MNDLLHPIPAASTARPPLNHAHAADRMTFGRFVVLPAARTLLLDGTPVCLGARAFDLLVVLLASRGEVVSKDEIVRHVWPTTTVDESNLRFQMTLLRKALGEDRDRIKTIPGRGYLLAVDIDGVEPGADAPISTWPMAISAPQQQRRAVSEALRALLRAFSRYPDALAALDGLLAETSAAEAGPALRATFATGPADALAH